MALQSITFDKLKFPLLGGLFLSAASSTLLHDYGRILGCSGSLHSLFNGPPSITLRSQSSYLAIGLALAGSALRLASPCLQRALGRPLFDPILSGPVQSDVLLLFIISGLLTGAGTKLGAGCTSGHMLCGMARGSKRSIVATLVFFPVAILTHRLLKPLLSSLGLFPSPISSISALSTSIASSFDLWLSASVLLSPIVGYVALRLLLAPDRLVHVRTTLLGAAFGAGLVLSGMVRPSVVLGFFSFPQPSWDPSLLGVALAGLGTNVAIYTIHIRPRINAWLAVRSATLASPADEAEREALVLLDSHAPPLASPPVWQLPEMSNNSIDGRLIYGSILFGLGWGLAGVCPGPGVVTIGAYPLSIAMWGWMSGFFVASKTCF